MSNFLKENKFLKTGPRGIINTEGDQWITQRRFSLKTLKDFGFGRKSLEDAISMEIDLIIEEFLSKEVRDLHQFKIELTIISLQDSDFLIGQDFNIPIINILWQLVAGYRFEKDNKHVNNITEIFQEGIKIHMIPMFLLKVSTVAIARNDY